jgi:hypothetical protein
VVSDVIDLGYGDCVLLSQLGLIHKLYCVTEQMPSSNSTYYMSRLILSICYLEIVLHNTSIGFSLEYAT